MKKNYLKPATEGATLLSAWNVCVGTPPAGSGEDTKSDPGGGADYPADGAPQRRIF